MSETITKHQSETYYISNNDEWGYFSICSELGSLAVNSSYGVFGFCWPDQKGEGFIEFLTDDGDTDYVMNKLTANNRLSERAERNFDKYLLIPFLEKVQREMQGESTI